MSKFDLESNMFDIIFQLHKNFELKRKDQYKLLLVALDELNEEYKTKQGNYYIAPERALSYYEKLWEM